MIRYTCFRMALFLLFVLVIACSDQSSVPAPEFSFTVTYSIHDNGDEIVWPDDQLKLAFKTYWDSRFEQDLDMAWSMEAPHLRFAGSKNNYKRFHSRAAGQILSEIVILRLDKVHDNMYRVVSELRISQLGKEQSAHISDSWVRVEGRWYHLERNPLIFPGSF